MNSRRAKKLVKRDGASWIRVSYQSFGKARLVTEQFVEIPQRFNCKLVRHWFNMMYGLVTGWR